MIAESDMLAAMSKLKSHGMVPTEIICSAEVMVETMLSHCSFVHKATIADYSGGTKKMGSLYGLDVHLDDNTRNVEKGTMYILCKDGGMKINADGTMQGGTGDNNKPTKFENEYTTEYDKTPDFKPKCGICAVLGKLCMRHS